MKLYAWTILVTLIVRAILLRLMMVMELRFNAKNVIFLFPYCHLKRNKSMGTQLLIRIIVKKVSIAILRPTMELGTCVQIVQYLRKIV